MRLDTTALFFISKEEIRVLTAVELGMRNHELVPVHIIERVARLKRANTYKVIQILLKNKLLSRDSKKYEGYKLTYLGYDYLALYAFMKRGSIASVIGKIGVGKESDIYKCLDCEGNHIVLKFARLGRVSFKAIKNQRDYLQGRKQYNWLYLSRLASIKEFSFMEILHKNGFPTPKPIDSNRHGILMSLIDGYTLCNVKELEQAQRVYEELVGMVKNFAEHGLVHSDFNEFNIMITRDSQVRIIDFPQMVSTKHLNADELYERDLNGVELWFTKRYGVTPIELPVLEEIEVKKRLDIEVKASGFLTKSLEENLKQLELLDNYNKMVRETGIQALDENYNSEDDEQMLIGDDDEEGEGEGEEQKVEEGEEHKIEDGEDEIEELEDSEDEEDEEEEDDEEESEEEEDEEARRKRREELKKKPKPKKEKKKKDEKTKEDDDEYIDNIMKKKFKPRRVIKKNVNKGKKKLVANDYFF